MSRAVATLLSFLLILPLFKVHADPKTDAQELQTVVALRAVAAVLPVLTEETNEYDADENSEQWLLLWNFVHQTTQAGIIIREQIAPLVVDPILRLNILSIADQLEAIETNLKDKMDPNDGYDSYEDDFTFSDEIDAVHNEYKGIVTELLEVADTLERTIHAPAEEIVAPTTSPLMGFQSERVESRERNLQAYVTVAAAIQTLKMMSTADEPYWENENQAFGSLYSFTNHVDALIKQLSAVRFSDARFQQAFQSYVRRISQAVETANSQIGENISYSTDEETWTKLYTGLRERCGKLATGLEPLLDIARGGLDEGAMTLDDFVRAATERPDLIQAELAQAISALKAQSDGIKAEIAADHERQQALLAQVTAAQADRDAAQTAAAAAREATRAEALTIATHRTEVEKRIASAVQLEARLSQARLALSSAAPAIQSLRTQVTAANTFGVLAVDVVPEDLDLRGVRKNNQEDRFHDLQRDFKPTAELLLRASSSQHQKGIHAILAQQGIAANDYNVSMEMNFGDLRAFRRLGFGKIRGFIGSNVSVTMKFEAPGFGRLISRDFDRLVIRIDSKGRITMPRLKEFIEEQFAAASGEAFWERLALGQQARIDGVIAQHCDLLLKSLRGVLAQAEPPKASEAP